MKKNTNTNTNTNTATNTAVLTINGQSISLNQSQIERLLALLTEPSKADAQSTTDIPVQTVKAKKAESEPIQTVSKRRGRPKKAASDTSKAITEKASKYAYMMGVFEDYTFVVDGNAVTYTRKDGSYLPIKSVRAVLNARIKNAGGKWDKESRKWLFIKNNRRDLKSLKQFIENDPKKITADELNSVIKVWNDHVEKKVAKKAASTK